MVFKSKGKLIATVLAIVLMTAFVVACGGNNNATTPANNTSENEKQTQPVKSTQERIAIATNPVGSAFNALGNGLASVISLNSDVQASVQPSAGVSAWAPSLNRGEVGLGVGNGPELIWAFNGEHDMEEPQKNIRLVVRGNYIAATGIVVREDAGINKVDDLKGKRVTSDYPGSIIGKMIIEASLVANNLTWKDVNNTPVPTITAGIEALQNSRVDAAFALVPSSPVMQEVHNAIGLRALHFYEGISPEQIDQTPQHIVDEITARVPGARMTVVKPLGYVEQDTVAIEYPSMMVSSAHLTDEAVYEILETLWAHYEELHPVHVWFKSWSPDLMFDPNPAIPYHPGAVQFFKDKDLWNDEVDKIQEELMKKATS